MSEGVQGITLTPEQLQDLLAGAIKVAIEASPHQRSPGLFLKTVPTIVSNWAKNGQNGSVTHDGAGPDGSDGYEVLK